MRYLLGVPIPEDLCPPARRSVNLNGVHHVTRGQYLLGMALVALSLGGCVAYEPVPVVAPQPSPQQRFDRAWDAAVAAMVEQGVTITAQDRSAGVIRGHREGVSVTATVQTQADGNVQVSFETARAGDKEPGLAKRLSESFTRRVGR